MLRTTAKFILWELAGDFLRFPIWWYSKGLKIFTLNFINRLKNTYETLGIGVWLKNLFKPMFGVTDWQGKIISFFVRFLQIIFRSIFFLFFVIIFVVLFLLWVLLPILIILQLVNIFFIHGR